MVAPEPIFEPAAPEPAPRAPSGAWRWILRGILALIASAVMGGAGLALTVLALSKNLPKFDALTDYQPKQVTKVFCADDTLCGELFHERRTVLPREQIPPILKQAVISAEDANFYRHAGLDYPHILHALVMDALHGSIRSGASTITQQVVKTFLLSPERRWSRKIKEAILARRLEQNLSKDEILALYLNQIYFGHHRYGVEEAARFYFGKSARALTLGEAALLAGLPQSPNRLNPATSLAAAKARQTYVLQQMAKNGYITEPQAEAEIHAPIVLAPEQPPFPGPYYLEEVRRQLEQAYGPEKLYEGGMRVQIAMDPRRQRAADAAVDQGLRELDKRQGYRGPLARLVARDAPLAPAPPADDQAELPDDEEPVDASATPPLGPPDTPAEATAAIALLHRAMDERLNKGLARQPGARAIWDLSDATQAIAKAGIQSVAAASRIRALAPGVRAGGVVSAIDDARGTALVDLGGATAQLHLDEMRWARPFSPLKRTARPAKVSDLLSPGDVVLVQIEGAPDDSTASVPAHLDQDPLAQGALVSIDPATRDVVALVGGADFERSSFDRAVQAHRQPGSSFKPYVFAAALSTLKYTPASIVNDAPELIRDPWTGKEWKPVNFEKDEFDGPMTLRAALAESKNTVAVRLAEDVGPDAIIDMARRAGITSPIPRNLTIALGTAEVSPLEHANGYATLDAGGKRADPILVLEVADKGGKVLERHQAAFTETIPPPVAFLDTSMMQSVIESGTGVRAQALGRPAAGKTGTAQDQRDAWFCGYTPDLVAVAWVGFDDHERLGYAETGAHAALPIWLAYMQQAEQDRPVVDFTLPPGVISARIDPKSGLLSADPAMGRLEYFAEGTAPKEIAPPMDRTPTSDFFFVDQGAKR